MVKVQVNAGSCGMISTIEAREGEDGAILEVTSDCPAVQEMAEQLGEVGMADILGGYGQGRIFELAAEHLTHGACPVPAGLIKAAEVALHLNLPQDAGISFIPEG